MKWPAALAIGFALVCGAGAKTERSAAAVLEFKRANPCPATGERRGACPGWQVDHIIPLCAGGPDEPANMHWLAEDDHRFKTLVDVRECRKLRRMAERPAVETPPP